MLARTPPPPPGLFKRLVNALSPQPPAVRTFSEMGVSGTAVFGGYVQTREKSPKWVGSQRYVTIADMAVNASIVAAGIQLFTNLIARPSWTLAPADESSEAEEVAEFVDEVLKGMSQPWSRIVRRATMFRFYGFGVQEWTALRRADGKVGLASIEPRPQHSILRWSVANNGSVEGVWQVDPATGRELGIPRSKILYLVDDTLSDSPEGIGIFRHLAEPWERLQVYYALESRAFERDLRGTPVGRIPYAQIREAVKQGEITEDQATALTRTVEDFVKLQVRQSDTAITLDSIPYYSQAADGAKVAGLPQWGLELLQGGAAGMAEVAAAITRTQTEMARVLAAEHLMMGESSGNRALGEDKSRNLYLVANAVLGDIAAGVDSDIIPVICRLNGIPEELYPKSEPEDVAFKSAESVAATLVKMAQAGATLAPNDPIIDEVRSLMGVAASVPMTPEMVGAGATGSEDAPEEDAEEPEDADEEEAEKAFNHDQPRAEDGKWTDGGGGSASGSLSRQALAVAEKYRDEQAWNEPIREFMEAQGLTLENYKAVNELFYRHNLTSGGEADDHIASVWNSNTNEGKAMRAFAAWNEWQMENSPVLGSNTKLYRKGNLDKPVISMTFSPRGARSAENAVGFDRPNIKTTYAKLRAQGYRMLAGVRGMVGITSSKEKESIWIKDNVDKAFNPDQPREPAGSPEGGQWTGGDGGAGSSNAGASSGTSSRTYSDPKTWKTAADVEKAFHDDFKFYIGRDSDSGISEKNFVERAGVIHESLRDLHERFPSLHLQEDDYRASGSALAVFEIKLTKGRDMEGAHSRALGVYNKSSFNMKLAASLQKGEGVLKAGDWTVGGARAGSVLRHELGHSTEMFFRRKLGEVGLLAPARNPIETMQHWYMESRATIGKTLSKYAATSREEWFAESFSAYTHPGYKSGKVKIHPKLEQAFAKIYGEPLTKAFNPDQPRAEDGKWTFSGVKSLAEIAEGVSQSFGADADKFISADEGERTSLLIEIMRKRDVLLEGVSDETNKWKKVDAGIDRLAGTIYDEANQLAVMESWLEAGAPDISLDVVAHHRYSGQVLDKIAAKLPANYKGSDVLLMYSPDYAAFEKAFVDNWTMAGGSSVQMRAHAALADVGVNAEKGLWNLKERFEEAPNLYRNIMERPSTNMQRNLLKLHAKTQSFYAEKYPGKDLNSVMLTVGRGVGKPVKNYAPAGMESWSLDKNTPKRFAGRGGTVLSAQVRVSSIVMSWESAKGIFPSEASLRGKKEVAVLGGGLSSLTGSSR